MLLIARGVRELAWAAGKRSSDRPARMVGGAVISNADRLFGLELGMWPTPGAQLRLVAESAAFFAGDVPGLDRIPDYMDDEESTICAQLAGWHSPFTQVHAVFLDAAPATS